MGLGRRLAAVQSAFFVTTGLWPLVSMRTFEAVTGRKRDRWLVQTMGVLIAAIGGVLATSAVRGIVNRETSSLGFASAAALGACDVVFVAQRRTSPVYLLDALVEASLCGAWAALAVADRRYREAAATRPVEATES